MNTYKLAGLAFLVIGCAGSALAGVPEIDPGSAVNALALVAGAVLVIRSRRRK